MLNECGCCGSRERDNEYIAETARKIFERWNSALLTGNSKNVAKLYSKDATFLPTVSGEFKRGQEGAEKYFEHFLEKHPNGKIVKEETDMPASDCIVHWGLYNFEVDGENGKRETVEARFTFVYKKNADGEWEIIHHHSSMKADESYERFLEEHPTGEIIEKEEIQKLGAGCNLHSGLYKFETDLPDGKKETTEARFSSVIQADARGNDKTTYQHLSKRPEVVH